MQHVGDAGQLLREVERASTHLIGEQQLPTGRGPQSVFGDLEAALVRNAEPANLLDRVAPELHAEGVFLRGREDIEDPASDGAMTTLSGPKSDSGSPG